MFTRVRHKPMRSRVVKHKTAKIKMILRHVHTSPSQTYEKPCGYTQNS